MNSRLGLRLRDPLFLLCLTAGFLAFVVQSGELGSADTMHRLQTTHWIWTSQPQVFPNEYPEFGLHGRDGHIYSWYGIGQSLLMLPSAKSPCRAASRRSACTTRAVHTATTSEPDSRPSAANGFAPAAT